MGARYLAVLAVSLSLLPSPARAWQLDCVDDGHALTTFSPLRFDAADRPHVALGSDHPYHAVRSTSGWKVETVDPVAGTGWSSSMDLDSAGVPHIASLVELQSGTTYRFQLSSFDGTSWRQEDITSMPSIRQYSFLALALDGLDHPILVHTNQSTNPQSLQAERWNGTGWQHEEVDTGVIDSVLGVHSRTGSAFFAYAKSRGSDYNVFVAEWNGSSWSVESPDPLAVLRQAPSVAADAQGNPLVAYQDVVDGSIVLARRNAGTWSVQRVAGPGLPVCPAVVAVDPAGTPAIAWIDAGFQVHLSRWDGSAWVSEDVTAPGQLATAYWAFLDFDSAGEPAIVLLEQETGDFLYFRRSGPIWSEERIDTRRRVDVPVLALSPWDVPWLTYRVQTGGTYDPVLAHWDGAAWRHAPAPVSAPGYLADISFDSAGRLCATLSEGSTAPYVQYGCLDGTAWTFEDAASGVLDEARMAHGADVPAIAFQSSGKLFVAMRLGGVWSVTSLMPSTFTLDYYNVLDVKVDSRGHPIVAWIGRAEFAGDELHISRWNGLSWQDELVRTIGLPAGNVVLSLDRMDRPLVGYTVNNDGWPSQEWLWTARWDGSAWSHEMLISYTDALRMSSPGMAFDAQDRPQLTWPDPFTQELKLATRDASGWSIVGVPEAGAHPWLPELVYGSNGLPVLAFWDWAEEAAKILWTPPPPVPRAIRRGADLSSLPVVATAPLPWEDPDPVRGGGYPALLFYQVDGVPRVELVKSAMSVSVTF